MSTNPPVFDPITIVQILDRHHVRFVMIGGFAAAGFGADWSTTDLDICYDHARDNCDRLAAALREMDAVPQDWPANVPFVLDGRTIFNGDSWTMIGRYGKLDSLAHSDGGVDYEVLLRNASRFEIAGIEYASASLADLILMKRASNRPRDKAHLQILEAIVRERGSAL